MLADNIRGDLFLLRPDGRREVLLEGRSRGMWELLRRPWRPVTSTGRDAAGNLWALADDRNNPFRSRELWMGRPGEKLSLVRRFEGDPFPHAIARRGRRIGLLSWRFGETPLRYLYADMPVPGQAPRWEALESQEKVFGSAWAEEGLAARLSNDATVLISDKPKTRWVIPGRALGAGGTYFPAYRLGTAAAYLVPVELKDGGRALVVCLPGGKVRVEWRMGGDFSMSVQQYRDGTIWGPREGTLRLVATPDGQFLPPIRTAPGARVLRARRDKVWLYDESFLMEVEARTGRTLKKTALSPPARQWYWRHAAEPLEEGFFYQTRNGLEFVDWDGRSRRML